MATLTRDKPRKFETGHDIMWNALPMVAEDIIYDGAAVGELNDTGTHRPLVSGDKFSGFAFRGQVDNSAGAAGARNIDVSEQGRVVLNVVGVTGITDEKADVYATDDDVFTLTVGGTLIGKVARWESGTRCVVEFCAFNKRAEIVVMHNGQTTEAATDRAFFLADVPYYIKSLACVFSVTAGGASALQVTKDTATDAPGAGTNLLTDNTASGFDLAGTANTPQYGTIATTAGLRKLAKGDRLSIDHAAAIQDTAGLKISAVLIRL